MHANDPDAPRPHGISRRSLLAAVPLSAALLALGTQPATAAPGRSGPRSVVYIEVNDHPLSIAGEYALAGTSTPVFDIAVIFAANINYDAARGSAYLHLNEQVQATLDDAANQIRPLQAAGTKVTLSILGNHQGAGFANFPNQAAAAAFAQELADVVDRYGLDGIDFDDEYANYGANGTGQPNDASFVHLVTALRERLGPDRLITLYNIGPSATRTSFGGVDAGSMMDYAWNPYYSTWQVPSIPGMTAAQYSPGAVDLTSTPQATAASYARRTVAEGYGVYLTYNLQPGDASAYVSSFTRELYGVGATYTG